MSLLLTPLLPLVPLVPVLVLVLVPLAPEVVPALPLSPRPWMFPSRPRRLFLRLSQIEGQALDL